MKIESSITLNLKIPELTEAVIVANRLAMRDTVVEVAGDTVKGSPWLTGNNARSIAYELGPGGEFAKEDLSGAVWSSSGYGGFLETGTWKMKGRPYFKPALDKNFTLEKFTEKIKEHLK
jgi:hypothetical protein